MFSVESPPSKDLLSKKTVVELRQICRDLRIQQAKIPKPVLIERILIHFGVAVEATEADRQPGEKRKSTTQKKSNSKKPKITNDSTSADGTLPMISTSAYAGPSPISSLSASLTATSVPIFTQAESAAGATSVLGSMEPVFSAIAAPVTSEPDASTSTNAIEPSSTVSKSDTLISSISFPEMNIPSGISSSQAAKSGFNSAAGVASVEDQSRKTLLDPKLCKKQNTNSNDTVGINIKDFNKRLPQKISSISASQTPISTVRKKQAVTSKMGSSTTKLTSLSKDKEGKSPITPTLFPAKDATAPANHKKFNVPLTSNGMPAFVSVISHPFSRPSVASTEPSKANVSKNLKTSTTKFTPAPRFIAPRPIKSASQVPNLPAEGNSKSCCSSRLSHPYPRLDCTISFPKLDHVLSDPLSEVLALVLAYLDISLVCQVECWSKISRISALHSYRHRLKLEFPGKRSDLVMKIHGKEASFKQYYIHRYKEYARNIKLLKSSWTMRLWQSLKDQLEHPMYTNPFNEVPKSVYEPIMNHQYFVSDRIMRSPDSEYQLLTAFKVYSYSLFMSLMKPRTTHILLEVGRILDVVYDESSSNELVRVLRKSCVVRDDKIEIVKEWCWALASHGEIIATDADNSTITWTIPAKISTTKLPPRWQSFLTKASRPSKIPPETFPYPNLLKKIVTKDESYPHSIHKRLTFHSNPDKFTTATVYILANCSGLTGSAEPSFPAIPHTIDPKLLFFQTTNSLNTSTSHFKSLLPPNSSRCLDNHSHVRENWNPRTKSQHKIDNSLFLSVESSEIVESVHFDGLVNELAIVHTIGCEGFYVLRYTGNVIGTVDDGISLLYQRLLNCTEAGKPVSRNVGVDEPGDCDNLWKEYFNGGLRGEV